MDKHRWNYSLRLRTTLGLAAALIFASQLDSAAHQHPTHSEPELLDTYLSDQSAMTFLVLDGLTNRLRKQIDTHAHLVIHNGRLDAPGLASRHSLGIRNYLTTESELSDSRFTIVVGRKCEKFSVEAWLVPEGAAPPSSENCSLEPESEVSAPTGKYDEYVFDYQHPDGALYSEPYLRLQNFADALVKDENSVGYIIGYASRTEESEEESENGESVQQKYWVWDKQGQGLRLADTERQVILQHSKLDPARIVTIDGGYRESRIIELWILPPGAPPKPTPTLFRTRQLQN